MSVLKAVIDTPTLQVVEPAPQVKITVASGLDGRRGSYIFASTLTDPSDAVSYVEITQSPDVRPLEYDIYISTTDGSQWQYRYNGIGELIWFFVSRPEIVQVLKTKTIIPAGHGVQHQIVHNRNTLDVDVVLRKNVAPYETVGCYVERTSVNMVTLKFSSTAPSTELVALVLAYV